MRQTQIILTLFLGLALLGESHAAPYLPQAGSSGGRQEANTQVTAPTRIAWHGDLTLARVEAQRTQRPLLVMSAAPHCRQVPGMW